MKKNFIAFLTLLVMLTTLCFYSGCFSNSNNNLTFNDACNLLKEEMRYGNEYNYEFSTERLQNKKVFVIVIHNYEQYSTSSVRLLPNYIADDIENSYIDFIEENFNIFDEESLKIEIYNNNGNIVYYRYFYGYHEGKVGYN